MSSIIDDLIFYRRGRPAEHTQPHGSHEQEEDLLVFCKKIQLSQGAQLIANNSQLCELSKKVQIKDMEYCIRMRIQKASRSLKIEARLLNGSVFQMVPSRETEILLLREIVKWHFAATRQVVLYVHRNTLVMVQQVHISLIEHFAKNKLTDFYNAVFIRNINQFTLFVGKYWDKAGNFMLTDPEQKVQLDHQLMLTQILSTTTTTFDLTEDCTEERHFETRMQQKRQDIANVKNHIVEEIHLERLVDTFYAELSENARGRCLKNNFEYAYMTKQKRFSMLLAASKYAGEKRIDDYIYNTVKVKVKDVMSKPFNEGGSSNIFVAKVTLSYISSVDSTSYFENQEKNDRLLVFKKLKPELEKKFKHKLEHQKNIVAKLKGGCSYFIPKYYRMESALDAEDTLMMEYLNGQELDFYVMKHHMTISLQTKLYLLLNVVHGLRYLANYQVVHLDLKPINIMVCRNLITKIIDYGEAYHPSVCDKNYSPGYTFPYVAPEVFSLFENSLQFRQSFRFNEKQDVFALGLILSDLIFNNKIYYFTNAKFRQVYTRKETLERYYFNWEKLDCGDSRLGLTLAWIVARCIDPDPLRRPSLDWLALSLKLILTSCSSQK